MPKSIAKQDIAAIVSGAIPTWDDDPDVCEYLTQILSAEDSYEDKDHLKEILTPFVGDEEGIATELIDKLSVLFGACENENNTPPHEDDDDDDDDVARQPRCLGESPASSPTRRDENQNIEPVAPRSEDKHGKKDRRSKRQERLEKKKRNAKSKTVENKSAVAVEQSTEDDATAWHERQAQGKSWGGRGYGGRGEYAGKVNSIKSNIHLSNVTVALPNGTELLQNATMDITVGHRYALTGRNGVGKSTLLHRLANRMVPGMPEMRVLLVQQQVEGTDKTPVEVLLEADLDRAYLLEEQESLETQLESGNVDETEIEQIAERLGNVMAELDAIGAETAENRANEILTGLQFTEEMLKGPTLNLSGGWKQRLALARALFVQCDLLLLDEATNHLDLHGLDWLIKYLSKDDSRTMIMVSHDRGFLDAVCTDVIRMEHQRLSYHPGNYSEYERQMAERAARDAQILDAAERQRSKAEAFVQKQQAMANKKSADPNKQRQAKMIKEKKMDRIGNYREDGKRYKNFSLKQMDEGSVRLAQKVQIEVDDPVVQLKFPRPVWPPGIALDDTIIRTENLSFAYDTAEILKDVTVELRRGSKVALVGNNGAGKTSLLKLFLGTIKPEDFNSRGTFWRHANIRIAHVSQYSVEELEEAYGDLTVVEYAEEQLRSGRASAEIVAKSAGNVRQYLGAFGLGGRHALQKISKLSGGERMRLSLATAFADEPQVLFLDESTNHVDIETLDYMSAALNDFEGTVLMVSHNQSFLSGFCKELWILEEGHLRVNYSDTASFDEVFSAFRSEAVQAGSLADKRQAKALLSKKATKQRTGARQNTALM